jgi:hypothetical protein
MILQSDAAATKRAMFECSVTDGENEYGVTRTEASAPVEVEVRASAPFNCHPAFMPRSCVWPDVTDVTCPVAKSSGRNAAKRRDIKQTTTKL